MLIDAVLGLSRSTLAGIEPPANDVAAAAASALNPKCFVVHKIVAMSPQFYHPAAMCTHLHMTVKRLPVVCLLSVAAFVVCAGCS